MMSNFVEGCSFCLQAVRSGRDCALFARQGMRFAQQGAHRALVSAASEDTPHPSALLDFVFFAPFCGDFRNETGWMNPKNRNRVACYFSVPLSKTNFQHRTLNAERSRRHSANYKKAERSDLHLGRWMLGVGCSTLKTKGLEEPNEPQIKPGHAAASACPPGGLAGFARQVCRNAPSPDGAGRLQAVVHIVFQAGGNIHVFMQHIDNAQDAPGQFPEKDVRIQ